MKVSVITTCFKAEKCIEKTLLSVLSQTYTDFEYIIMDGHSTDNTVSIAKLYTAQFEKKNIPFYVFSQKDRGIYDGMNHGVSHARGEFIIFLNADDTFYSRHTLEHIFSGTKNYDDTDIIYGDAAEIEYDKAYYFPKNMNNILRRMPFSHQACFARKELLIAHPFSMSYNIVSDYDFIITCYDEGAVFTDCGEIISCVTKTGVSSVNIYDTFVETENMLKSHGHARYTDAELDSYLKGLKIRQLGMNYLPASVKKIIRNNQRKKRGQDIQVPDSKD